MDNVSNDTLWEWYYSLNSMIAKGLYDVAKPLNLVISEMEKRGLL